MVSSIEQGSLGLLGACARKLGTTRLGRPSVVVSLISL